MRSLAAEIGFLRSSLLAIIVILVAAAPFALASDGSGPLGFAVAVVAPVFFVVMLFVLPLDMLMTRIFMLEKEGDERLRFRFIMRVELALYAILVASWTPFVWQLIENR